MAVMFRTGRGLILGLVMAALTLTALARSRAEAEPERAPTQLALAETRSAAAPTPEQVAAIARTQRCWAELGYYKGEVDGKRGRATWSAFWQFKHEHGLAGESDILSEPVQQKIAVLCKLPPDTATGAIVVDPLDPLAPGQAEDAAAPDVEDEDELALTSPESADGAAPAGAVGEQADGTSTGARLDLDCLPDDAVAVLRRAHGLGVAAKTCERPCVATPAGLPQAQIDQLQAAGSVVWCRTCVALSGQLPLDDVRRIERAGNIELCPTPPRQLSKYGEGVTDGLRSSMRVRALYRALPPAAEDADAVAVIIGNRSYDRLPRSVTSYNDADAFYAFLTEHLGYRPDNIIDLRDAKKADLERVFGAEPGTSGELARLVQSTPGAKVVVYYSGHGATDEGQTETYLLPVDTEPYGQAFGGYKLSTLYANLAKLDARSVLVLLETEYGRDHGPSVLPPNLPETLNTALPKEPVPSLTVLAATDRGQRSLPDPTYDIGLFTRYVIEGLAGGADLAPVGNGDGALDSAEIYAFTAAFVDLAARKTYGVFQHPIYSGAATTVLTMRSPRAASGSN